MIEAIRTERLSAGRILVFGWRTYRSLFKDAALVFLIVYFPVNLVLNLLPAEDLSFAAYLRIVQILEALIGIIATLALARLIEERLQGRPFDFKDALKHGFKRWGHGVGTGLIAGVIILGLLLLLVVPGIVWAVYYTFVVYAVSLRGKEGREALAYSKALVKGRWWRVFGIFLLINLLMILCLAAAGLPVAFLPTGPWTFPLQFLADTVSDVIYALFISMETVFFLNIDYLHAGPLAPLAPRAAAEAS